MITRRALARRAIALGAMLVAMGLVWSSPSHAQRATAARFRLVRCGVQREAACLAARVGVSAGVPTGSRWIGQLVGISMVGPDQSKPASGMPSDVTPVFGAPVLPTSSLGRSALHGSLTLSAPGGIAISIPATWRPPLLALPVFVAVADSSALPTAVRDAIALGVEPPGIRVPLMLLMALTGVLLVTFVPRFAWTDHRQTEEDLAHQLAAARALLSTQELEQLRGTAPREGKPRQPEDATKEAIRAPWTR